MAIKYPNLRAEMARQGVSVSDLAEYMGMTHQNLYNKLSGRVVFTEKDIKAIQKYLSDKEGVTYTLDYLFENN